jgi:diacylglycerol O-acyltransferase
MRQLSGVDALHVLEETDRQHMHTIKIAIVGERFDGRGPVSVDEVVQWARERLPRVPPLRWRVHKIPLGLGRPVFIDAGPIDVDQHIRVESLPAPGNEREFDECVSRIASVQLARNRPLWDLTIVDGRADGGLALVFKLHHSIMDGQASVRFLEVVFDHEQPVADAPSLRDFPPPPERSEPTPTPVDLVRFAVGSQARLLAHLPKVARRTAASIRDNRSRKASGAPPVVNPLSGPRTRFNGLPVPERVYTDVTLPLSEMKELRAAAGATLNEVFVTLAGGALRRHLEQLGELPDKCLNAAHPVSLRKPEEMNDFCNRTSYWYVSLGTTYADPAERLAHVKDSLAAARAWADGDVELFSVWQDYYFLFGLVTLGLLSVMERVAKRPAFNAVVSNVRGPVPLTLAGAPVEHVRSMGPITRTLGINLTVWSYRDNFSIGIHSTRAALPDPSAMVAAVRAEFAAMRAAFGLTPGDRGITLDQLT